MAAILGATAAKSEGLGTTLSIVIALTVALIGVTGVLAGSLVTYKAQMKMLLRQEQARTIAAARILLIEITAVEGVLALATIGSKAARLHADRIFDAWSTHAPDLTRVDDWQALANVLAVLAAIRPFLNADKPIPQTDPDGNPIRLQQLLATARRSLEVEADRQPDA